MKHAIVATIRQNTKRCKLRRSYRRRRSSICCSIQNWPLSYTTMACPFRVPLQSGSLNARFVESRAITGFRCRASSCSKLDSTASFVCALFSRKEPRKCHMDSSMRQEVRQQASGGNRVESGLAAFRSEMQEADVQDAGPAKANPVSGTIPFSREIRNLKRKGLPSGSVFGSCLGRFGQGSVDWPIRAIARITFLSAGAASCELCDHQTPFSLSRRRAQTEPAGYG